MTRFLTPRTSAVLTIIAALAVVYFNTRLLKPAFGAWPYAGILWGLITAAYGASLLIRAWGKGSSAAP